MSNNENVVNLHDRGGHNADLLAILEELADRVRAGSVMGLAIVEHQRSDAVVIQVSSAANYHFMNSGAARLAHFLAGLNH